MGVNKTVKFTMKDGKVYTLTNATIADSIEELEQWFLESEDDIETMEIIK